MSEEIKSLFIASEAEMQSLAEAIAKTAKMGDVFLLDGELGVGKSFFSRQFIKYLNQKQSDKPIQVPSPTFTLVQIYDHLSPPVWHFDLYRLSTADEAYELGLDDAIKTAICLIEWPARLENDLPKDALPILFKHDGENSRNLEFILNKKWQKRLNYLF